MAATTSHRLPIIVYHSVDEKKTSISTPLAFFKTHINWLAEHGWSTIRLSQAAQIVKQGGNLPPRSCVLTFDDAMQSIRDIADPILRDHGFTATTFVVTGQAGEKPHWFRLPDPYRDEPLLGRADLEKLAENGWEMHPHTHNHPVMSHLPEDVQREEIEKSRSVIRDWFDQPGDVLAYPYGQFNNDTQRAMTACGMAAGVSLRFSASVQSNCLMDCPRIGSAWFKDSPLRIKLATAGLLEWYVSAKARLKGDRSRHFQTPTSETVQGLIEC
ncbi:MAG: hypothetical protein D8M59_01305 [Planctomycetes bacterium]|nr:hypothetical protein [Planctomycetota bacterium]NOG54644.1 polysaccharide deacetylase family protein [Planctomycetota bacterium]